MAAKAFSISSKNLWFQIALLVLGIIAGLGVHLPSSPEAIAENITNTLSTSGLYAVFGILLVSVVGPVYNFINTKPKITLSAFLGDPNNWVYFASFAASVLVLIGINIPEGTGAAIVNAIWVKDYAALASVVIGSVVVPVVRFFQDRAAGNVAP